MKKHKPLSARALYQPCSLPPLDFASTAELEPLDRPLGQARALEAIEFGVDIDQQGFNLFVIGAAGVGRHALVSQILGNRASHEATPPDCCYVNNFDNPQKPRVLRLPPGMGRRLRKDMESLVEDLLTSLPSSFQSDEYQQRRQEIDDELNDRQDQVFKRLNDEAEQEGIGIMRTKSGYTLSPVKDGKMLSNEAFRELPLDDQERVEKQIADLQIELQQILRSLPLMQREHRQRIKALNQEITRHTVEQLIAWIEQAYRDQADVMQFLAEVKQHAIDNVEAFMPEENAQEGEPIKRRVEDFNEFSINVIVDNGENSGAPIVFEDNPTFQNLVGRVEYVSHMGNLLTDFTLIKAGALHRANGGYLILDAHKLLSHSFSWEGLKRALKAGEIRIQSLEQMLSLASTLSLEPESQPLQVKVIVIGEPMLYYLIKQYDHEFNQLFKVAADFSTFTERSRSNVRLYARLIAAIQQNNGGRALTREAVGRVIERSSRMVDDREKLSLHVDSIKDLLAEADYWAGKAASDLIRLEDIETTISKQLYRQDKYREHFQQQIVRGVVMIDTAGEKVAQVNGLSVLQIGDFMFGQPSRITATARLGRGNIIDIERESKLGGQLHTKGVMILSSYLASRYAAEQPLPLSASLVFEQSYGGVDGDSATAAELCVLLSALGRIPLRQSLAVTGSMNQLGEIQAIGGVNEKIEGFFDICRERGLSGEHGVVIPAANQANLMLREDIRQAASAGMFHVYVVSHVEDVMELLSGRPRGRVSKSGKFTEGSFNRQVQARIEELIELERQHSARGKPAARKKSPTDKDKAR
jgi:predicted ATP-dependent protease